MSSTRRCTQYLFIRNGNERLLCFKCRRIDDFHFHTSKLWFRRTEKKTLIQPLVPWHYDSWFRNWEFWNPLRFLVDISTQWQVSCLISDILRRPLNWKKYPTFFCNLLMSSTRRCTQYLFIRNGNERLLCFKCRRIAGHNWFPCSYFKVLISHNEKANVDSTIGPLTLRFLV